ncbi:MAG: M23 family metallopeptidase [Synergistaceae bacterium]|nr:M23 family metallopeptidase [Synergistaceae bacterium]
MFSCLRTYGLWSAFFIVSLGFFSGAFAEEAPRPPGLVEIPSLPPLQVFGTPNPPNISHDAFGVMPHMTFWQKSAAVPSEAKASGPKAPKAKAIPVDPGKYPALAWPVRGKVSSGYGLRGAGLRRRMHQGIDIPVPVGTPIQAALAGVVAEARQYNGYGKTVILAHGKGTKTLYAHCSEFAVKQGDQVEQGQVIAYAGDTGRATTSHLHFGVMVEGSFRDPRALLQNKPQQLAQKP